MMNVSVVVPTLNERESIPDLFLNLMPQLEDGDEAIIVDGGSKDGTVKIAQYHGATVLEAENSSIGEARNIGSKYASNEIVASTDADSLPPEGWLDRIKNNFKKDEELVVLWGNVVDFNGVPIRNLVGKFSTITRGASGNNTAFRKKAFDELEEGYPDVSFMEDVFIINRLAKVGKAKRDSDLIMVMDMDRKRYQTIPMMGLGVASSTAGHILGGNLGDMAKIAGVSMVGTELTYEGYTDSPVHHDQVGTWLIGVGRMVDGKLSNLAKGSGAGLFAHHVLTEGLSMKPTQLYKNTDVEV
jgi:hypothetical protein